MRGAQLARRRSTAGLILAALRPRTRVIAEHRGTLRGAARSAGPGNEGTGAGDAGPEPGPCGRRSRVPLHSGAVAAGVRAERERTPSDSPTSMAKVSTSSKTTKPKATPAKAKAKTKAKSDASTRKTAAGKAGNGAAANAPIVAPPERAKGKKADAKAK